MIKIFKIILRICAFLFGCYLMLGSLGGVLVSFHSPSTFTIILTIILFVSSILLICFALKGLKSKIKNRINTNHITEQYHTQNNSNRYEGLNASSVNNVGNMYAPNSSTVQNNYLQQNSNAPRTEIPSASDIYVESANHGIIHADNSPITNEEVPYLVQLGYEQALENEYMSSNPKFHRSIQEKELSFRFSNTYSYQIHAMENRFQTIYRTACNEPDINAKISLLTEALNSFENTKSFCYSKGTGGTIYFQDTWECLHNSRNACFSYADTIQHSLNEALLERDIIIPGILNAIYENGHVLQKDLYKLLPTVERQQVQYVVQKLERNNYIIKTKSGNSYDLRLKN